MKCDEFNNLTDNYLLQELEDDAREQFEMHYFECDDCFAQLKVKERLFSKEIPIVTGEKKAFRLLRFKPAFILASVFLLVIISSITYVSKLNDQRRHDYLYQISAFSPPVYFEGETRNNQATALLPSAMKLYQKKEYAGALTLLKKIENGNDNPQVTFFKGVCNLLLDVPEDALPHLNQIIQSMDPAYYDEAIYYKGIALLRMDQTDKALEQFRNLASMYSPYREKAKQIIGKIETEKRK